MECLHYALNLPTLVVITGCPNVKILDQAFEAARTLHPLTEAEVIAILDKTDQAAVHGKYEPYKGHHAVRRNDSPSRVDDHGVRKQLS